MQIFSTSLVAVVTPLNSSEDILVLTMELLVPADHRTDAQRTALDMGQALARSANYLEEKHMVSFYVSSCEEQP